METLWHDLRFASRWMIKKPMIALAAILSLALGIGANTTIFSLVNELFLRPVPVEEPSRVLAVYTVDERNPGLGASSHLNWKDLREQADVFEEMMGYDYATFGVSFGEEPIQVFGLMVSGNYFSGLGVVPHRGRFFTAVEDDTPGTHPVVVLSHGFWTRRLAADDSIVGQDLTINGQPFTVVGVAPPGFRGTDIGLEPELFAPMMMNRVIRPDDDINWYEERRGLFINSLARLAEGKDLDQAKAQLRILGQRLETEYPNENKGRSFDAVPLNQAAINPNMRGIVARSTTVLMVIVGLVLLIACANVANLLLARANERRREIATRLSLGANRGRLIRQLITESLMIALAGAVAGLGVAMLARDALLRFLPQLNLPINIALDLRLDTRVLLFTLGIAILTGILFGLAPALQSTRPNLITAIRERGDAAPGRFRWLEARHILVVSQVAFSVVALVGATLFLRSLEAAGATDPGFDADGLAVAGFDVGLQGYDQDRGEQFFQRVLDRVRSAPGVTDATLAQAGPFQGTLLRSILLEGQPPDSDRTFVMVNSISDHYFETLGVPIVQGRAFDHTDRADAVPVVIVNETMAERYWPDKDPVGQRFTFFGFDQPVEVVGVAKDSKYVSLGEDPRAFCYLPIAQLYTTSVTVVARTVGSPSQLLPTLRREIGALDSNLPLVGVETVDERIGNSLWASRFAAWLLGIFGLLALVLAVIGLYGVLSYAVNRRSREIGIRMAIGARRVDVLGLILRQSLTLVGAGLIAGALLAYLSTRLIANMLYVSATDPTAFAASIGVLLVAAGLASLLPARRATSIQPIRVLRYD